MAIFMMFRAFKSQNSISRLVQGQVSLHNRPAKAFFSYSHHKTDKFPHSNPDAKTNIHHHPQGILIPKLLTQLHLLADQLEPAFFIAKMSENWEHIFLKSTCNYIKT